MSELTALQQQRREYWRRNVRLIVACLSLWAFVSYGLGIVLAPVLNVIAIGGYPLGFWFAHQGAIYTFVVIIFFYAWRMNKLDREFDVDEP